jgi:hypothetical protein
MTVDIPTLRENLAKGEDGHPELHNNTHRALKQLYADIETLQQRVSQLELPPLPPADPERRYALYTDDYDSIQAALLDAALRKLPTVYLNPAGIYDIDATLIIPPDVTLDGGGRGLGALNRAVLRAATALDPIIDLSNYSRIVGCRIDGAYKAVNGVLVQRNFNVIEANWFHRLVVGGAAVKAGGALYTRLIHNAVSDCAGYGLDALDIYSFDPQATYYGINHGYSEQNIWGARMGGIRMDGLLHSNTDDFEIQLDGEAAVTVGGSVSASLKMTQPYFELTAGSTEALTAISMKGSSRLDVQGGQAHGQSKDLVNSAFLRSQTAYGLNVQGVVVNRWQKCFTGTVANNAQIFVAGNAFINVGTKSDLSGLELADVSLFHV